MKKIIVHPNFVNYCVQQNILTHLCYYFKFKHWYVNSCHYKYCPNKLAKSVEVCNRTAAKHAKWLLDRGWARMHGDNLVLKRISEIYTIEKQICKNQTIIKVPSLAVPNIKFALRVLLFKNGLRQQQYMQKLISDLIKPATLKAYKKAVEYKRSHPTSSKGAKKNFLTCTVKSIGQRLGFSSSSSSRFKQQLSLKGWFIFRKRIERVYEAPDASFKAVQNLYRYATFWSKGHLYMVKPSIVIPVVPL